MKYIILRDEYGAENPVFFLAPFTHLDIAEAWTRVAPMQAVSAGFVRFLPDDSVATFGRSESLHLSPRPQDASLIRALYRATLKTATP